MMWMPWSSFQTDFDDLVAAGYEPALELREMIETRRPEEIFTAETNGTGNSGLSFLVAPASQMGVAKV
jgi:hypothetical protein